MFQGEKLSADKEAADQFIPKFRKLIEDEFSHNQVFNCDETTCTISCWNLFLHQVLKNLQVEARKKSKDQVTLNVCSNTSGSIKLPIHLIGKAQRPRCFKGTKMELLPVKYSGQTNAWMISKLFHEEFVPQVR